MTRDEEIALIDEILGLREAETPFLDEQVTSSPVEIYTDPARFRQEQARIFARCPQPVLHVSDLAVDGAFAVRTVAGASVLLTRDRDGAVRAFHNVCRHRGARLVEAAEGCRHRFTCPYHAWTWDNRGRLIGAPHGTDGFPDMDKATRGLVPVACAVRHGWVWVALDADQDTDAFLSPVAGDLDWLDMAEMEVFARTEQDWACNWKLVVEGGLEAYHFRVAHADTIATFFHDNLSTYRMFGPHIRSVLPRRSIDMLAQTPRDRWRIREHANVLYTMFPSTAFLAQADHVAVVRFQALAADLTRIEIATVTPRDSAAPDDHWKKNHALTLRTLEEDFRLAESIQKGLAQGANAALTFGRFEGALHRFNQQVAEHCVVD